MLDHIRIVLIKTSHPGNIGSVARAMKTMGLKRLYLVSPNQFPHDKANEMASGAGDILDQTIVVTSLAEAITDCSFVVGASARIRTIPWPFCEPRVMASKIKQEYKNNQIAILFGCEQSGLSNEELESCHLHVQIPADAAYSSLNIAAAVQVIAYELRLASLASIPSTENTEYLATMEEMENFFIHLQQVLVEIDFLKIHAPRKLMTRLRRFFLRAQPDQMEVNMLRGMLTAIQETRNKS
ncbi:MAG: hypothetical protein A3F11_10405 [Gammaproteobacteria bacterium RIFCSPHIGHO2_12_FULL_37_14]|nr:MAG: hypothetical protein A3F11_10405 [Gammaproteobacteria bacterium RIFCSPHIGHO2_12_FULL_37_14]